MVRGQAKLCASRDQETVHAIRYQLGKLSDNVARFSESIAGHTGSGKGTNGNVQSYGDRCGVRASPLHFAMSPGTAPHAISLERLLQGQATLSQERILKTKILRYQIPSLRD